MLQVMQFKICWQIRKPLVQFAQTRLPLGTPKEAFPGVVRDVPQQGLCRRPSAVLFCWRIIDNMFLVRCTQLLLFCDTTHHLCLSARSYAFRRKYAISSIAHPLRGMKVFLCDTEIQRQLPDVPMEMPTEAAAKAGASLTPSPVCRTLPWVWSSSICVQSAITSLPDFIMGFRCKAGICNCLLASYGKIPIDCGFWFLRGPSFRRQLD